MKLHEYKKKNKKKKRKEKEKNVCYRKTLIHRDKILCLETWETCN